MGLSRVLNREINNLAWNKKNDAGGTLGNRVERRLQAKRLVRIVFKVALS